MIRFRFRIYSSIIAIAVILPIFINGNTFVKAEENWNLYENLLTAIGIIDKVNSDSVLTRGELAKYTGRLKGVGITYPFTEEIFFTDVNENVDYAPYINTLAKEGLLKGYGDGAYDPDKPAYLNEAVKIIIDILGYQYIAVNSGSYPGGYLQIASKLGLLKGIKSDGGYCFGDTLVRLLYNSLDIKIMSISNVVKTLGSNETDYIYKGTEGRTLLYEYHGMRKAAGVVQGNHVTNLSEKPIKENQLLINNTPLDVINKTDNNLVGFNVIYVYKEEDEKNLLLFVHPYQNNIFEISAEDFIGISSLSISYEDNQLVKKKQISPLADIIYNGKVADYSDSLFNGIKTGKIILIDNNNDNNYEIVNIESYTSIIIGSINYRKNLIYDLRDSGIILDLSDNLCGYSDIFDERGSNILIEDLKENDVLTYYYNQGYFRGYVSKNVVEGILTEKNNEKPAFYVINNKKYLLSMELVDLDKPLGMIKAYLDYRGKIVYVETTENSKLKIGVLLAAKSQNKDIEDLFHIKILQTDGEIKLYECAERVSVNGDLMKRKELPDDWAQGIIAYSVSENDEITEIQIPNTKDTYKEGNLYISYPKKSAYHYKANAIFDGKIIYDSNTKFFELPFAYEELAEDDVRAIDKTYFSERTSYTIEAYNFSKNDMFADVIVNYSKVGSTSLQVTDPLGTISRIYSKYTEQYGVRDVVDIYVNGDLKTYYLNSLLYDDTEKNKIKAGDIVRYCYNSKYEIYYLEAVYRTDAGWLSSNPYYGSTNNIYDSLRIIYGTVTKVTDKHVRYTLGDSGSFLMDDFAFPKSRYPKITIVENNHSRLRIRSGKAADIEIGDKIIKHTSLQAPVSLIVFK